MVSFKNLRKINKKHLLISKKYITFAKELIKKYQ